MTSDAFDISIQWGESGGKFSLGDRVTGTLCVKAHRDCDFDEARLWARWGLRGLVAGIPPRLIKGVMGSTTLKLGRLRAGAQASYPFSIDVMIGPCSSIGNVCELEWHVLSELVLRDEVVGEAESKFVVAAAPIAGDYAQGSRARKSETYAATSAEINSMALWGLCCLSFAGLFYGFCWVLWTNPDATFGMRGLLGFLFASFAGYKGVLALYRYARYHLSKYLLGDIRVELVPAELCPGESFECQIDLSGARKVWFTRVISALRVEESFDTTDLPEDYLTEVARCFPYQKQFFIEAGDIRRAREEQDALLSQHITIPPGAPCSFYGEYYHLRWYLVVGLEVRFLPDWAENFPLEVVPGRICQDDRIAKG